MRLPRVTPGEGGRKRLKAARGGGGGGEELEKSVSGELIERGSGRGGGLQGAETDKADAVSQPLASSCNPRGPRVKQVFPGWSVCASLAQPD